MKILFAFWLMLLFVNPFNGRADELTTKLFEKLHAGIVPEKEAWKTIPWHTDLLTAQAAAVKQKKLIFIWAMDGHPLGCT